ncbi:MAG: hypothetical protein ACNA7I_08555 [Candidatus Methanoperedens sp.]
MMSSVMSLLMPVRDVGIFCAHHGFHEWMDWSSMFLANVSIIVEDF